MSLKRNTIWNLAGSGLPLIAAAALIPFTLRRLGNEAFGVLTLIWALIGYFSLFDMGIGRALTFEMSKLRANNDSVKISAKLKAGLTLTAGTGMVGAILMMVLSPFLAKNWLGISPLLQRDAQLAFQIAAIGVVLTTINSGMRGALEGLERFGASNLNKIFLGLCMFILPAGSTWMHGPQLWVIALYLVVARLAVVIISALQLGQYFYNDNYRLLSEVKSLMSYGLWVSISGIVSPLMVYGDRFFVSATVGPEQLPLYAIPQEGLQRLLIIPAAICGALLPKLSALRPEEMVAIYRVNASRVMFIMLFICTVAAVCAYPVLSMWLSRDFAIKALPIVVVLAIGIWLNSMAFVPYTLLHAFGNPRITALFHIFELVLYVIALYILAKHFGLLGAAIAWVARVSLDLVVLRFTANCHIQANQVKNSGLQKLSVRNPQA